MTQNPEDTLTPSNPDLAAGNGSASSKSLSSASHSRASGTTGPRTAQGREKSKRNAVGHGIFSNAVLLKDEPRAEYDALLRGLRQDLRPEGTLENLLVEKLSVISWRHRRLIVAETSEIRKSIEFLDWDEEQRQTERANQISEYSIEYAGGLIRRIDNPKVLERCLELLMELKDGIEAHGFDLIYSRGFTKLYGGSSNQNWQENLYDSCQSWSKIAKLSAEDRKGGGFPSPEECVDIFVGEMEKEISRLQQHKKARRSIESVRMKFEALGRSVPEAHQLDRLLRYEASLERGFDRTLSQLERLQRMRLGQPVLPELKVRHSLS
jgi:hypothetical protein